MFEARSSARLVAALLAFSAYTVVSSAQTTLELRATDERAPAGALVQMKIEATEPKPISTGSGQISFAGFDEIAGIAAISPQNDTYGVAVVGGSTIALSLVSPSSTFGTLDDYPLVMITGRVPSNVPSGVLFPFRLEPESLKFRNANGKLHTIEVEDGSLTIAPVLSIHDVQPGSRTLSAGSTVRIFGSGFRRETKIQFGTASIASKRFISSSQIDVVLGSSARMHGMRIRAENEDGPRIEYFSYQRAYRLGASIADVYRDAVPVFPNRASLKAVVDLTGYSAGLAVQNIKRVESQVTAELFAGNGSLLAKTLVTLPANRYLLHEISELFEVAYQPGSFVRVQATSPVQVMGISVSEAGKASPVLPQ